MEKKLKIVNSVITSAVVVVIFLAVITIGAGLQPGLKDWLKNTFSHHWIGKSILAVALFASISFLLSILPFPHKKNKIAKNLWLLFWITLAGTMAIFGFYLYETFLVLI